jgi:hypothetical protein
MSIGLKHEGGVMRVQNTLQGQPCTGHAEHKGSTIPAAISHVSTRLHTRSLPMTVRQVDIGPAREAQSSGHHEREGSTLRHRDQNRTAQMPQLHGIEQGKALVNQQTSSRSY